MMERTREYTADIIHKVAQSNGLSYEPWMQDWDIQLASPDHLRSLVKNYSSLTDPEERVVLMRIILASYEDRVAQCNYCQDTENWMASRLRAEWDLHRPAVEYWATLDALSGDEMFNISPLMQQLWMAMEGGLNRTMPCSGLDEECDK